MVICLVVPSSKYINQLYNIINSLEHKTQYKIKIFIHNSINIDLNKYDVIKVTNTDRYMFTECLRNIDDDILYVICSYICLKSFDEIIKLFLNSNKDILLLNNKKSYVYQTNLSNDYSYDIMIIKKGVNFWEQFDKIYNIYYNVIKTIFRADIIYEVLISLASKKFNIYSLTFDDIVGKDKYFYDTNI